MLSPRWRKVIRDLWDNKARTILVVLAIAVGVFAFGSAFITQDVLLTDMNAQYRAANTASIVMSISSFDQGLVRWAQRQDNVADAQGRAVYLVQLVTPDGKHNLNLYAVSDADYADMRINRVTPVEGTWPPGDHEIVFERSSVALTGASVGDPVVVELPSGRQRELAFAGTAHDLNAIPANLFPQITGYVSFDTLAWLGYPVTYNQLNVVAKDDLSDTVELAAIGDALSERLRHQDVIVGAVTVQDPSKHWGSDVTAGFTIVLSGIGVMSLILSGFLVVNTITGVLAQQKRQIGMMKAVGATNGQVTAVYLTMVAAFGLMALAVALPVGTALAYVNVSAVANFLNIDVLHFHVPLSVLALELAAALIAPLASAMVPILSGMRLTVREAISDYGLGTQRRRGLIDLLLTRVRGLPRPTLLSLRNTFRRRGRLMLTLGTLTLAGALFISVVNVRGSLMEELFIILGVYNYDVAIILDDNYQSQGVERRAMRVPGVTGAQGLATVIAKRVRDDGTRGPTFEVQGVPPTSSLLQPNLVDGRWLRSDDRNTIVVSSEWLTNEPDVQLGDTITLEIRSKESDWEVVGVYLLPGDPTAYATFDRVSRAQDAPGMSSFLLVSTESRDGAFQDAVAKSLEEQLKDAGIGVSQSITRDLIVGASVSQFDFLVAFLLSTAVMVAIVGGLGLAGTMSLNVLERTREIGVMRAIGASNAAIRGIVLLEGILIGLMSWMLALPLSAAMSLGLSAALGLAVFQHPLPASFSVAAILLWLLIAVALSTLASLLPASRAASISVREALAYE